MRWNAGTSHATNVPVDIVMEASSGTVTVRVDESKNAGAWFTLGTYTLDPATASVTIRNTGTNGMVLVDAIQFSQGAVTQPSTPTATRSPTVAVNDTGQSELDEQLDQRIWIHHRRHNRRRDNLEPGGHGAGGQHDVQRLGLTANTTYAFRVRAFNSAGASQNATSSPVTTPAVSGPSVIVDDNDPGVIFTGRWWSTQLGGAFYEHRLPQRWQSGQGGSNIKFSPSPSTMMAGIRCSCGR